MTDTEKLKRKKFSNWVRTDFKTEDALKILFSDEKTFDIDGVCNAQNNRMWAVDRDEVDEKGGRKQKRKFFQKVMIWLGVCSKGVRPLVFLDKGTTDTFVKSCQLLSSMETRFLAMIGHTNKIMQHPTCTI